MTTILLQPSAAWWTKFAQIREYASIKDFHELLTVLAGLKPEDETEYTAAQMQEIVALQNQIADMERRYQDTCTTDPRTEAQKDLDAWQKEASDTRATDYPY